MNADLADHPFSPENIASESGEGGSLERSWMRWSSEVERLLGHILDGCDPAAFDASKAGCGYSIDEALEQWKAGTTPHAYVAMVTSRDRYDGGAFVRA